MSALGNIIRKEIKELLTPATFIPIIVIAIIFGSMGGTIGDIEQELEEKPVIGFINMDDGNISKIATGVLEDNADVVYKSNNSDDKQEALEKIREKDGVALVIFPENLSDFVLNNLPGEIKIYWVMKGAGILDGVSSETVNFLVEVINTNISKYLIQQNNKTMNVSNALTPTYRNDTTYFKGNEYKGLSPGDITSVLSSQSTTIPIIMMMIIIMSGGMVISSMALEKENKTMETLLTLPVKRTSIVTGKIIASAVIGLMLAVIYMLGLSYYMQSFQIQGNMDLGEYNLILTTSDLLIIGLVVFITLVAGLSLCMLLGTMAKNYKSAQTLTFPVTIMALIPMFITMFKDFDTLPTVIKGVLFAIPFSHPMMAPRALIFDDYLLVIAGLIYVSIFALIMISLAVWVFKTDKLLTGRISKKKVGLSHLFRRK